MKKTERTLNCHVCGREHHTPDSDVIAVTCMGSHPFMRPPRMFQDELNIHTEPLVAAQPAAAR